MTVEYYAGEYRRYQTYCRNYGNNRLYRIVGGPNVADYHWMEVMMRDIPTGMKQGVSLHYYTVPNQWSDKGSATDFDEAEYYRTIRKAYYMDELVTRHGAIMDRYDPEKRVGLVVDEWGNWFNVEPGTNPGFLYQQNTLRDAIVAGVTLNIFNNHADRVKMANIAQLVNVLQSLFLTDGEKMLLTPTYHVFDMYKVHHDATLLPTVLQSPEAKDEEGKAFPQVTASASRDADGKIHLSLVNADLQRSVQVKCVVHGAQGMSRGKGQVITSENIRDCNSFENPNRVVLYDFDDFSVDGEKVTVNLPAMSVVTVELK